MPSSPVSKYRPFPPVSLPDRQWPGRVLTQAPLWLATDLRDGNQALFEPMSLAQKLEFFALLVRVGFKHIEVGFPSASQVDHDFVRTLIEGGHIPDDVWIQVLTPARKELIEKTISSLAGAKRAIVHLYNSTAPVFREVVFGMSQQAVLEMAVGATRTIRELTRVRPETEWQLEYSPEMFSATELGFALEVCNAVTWEWQASAQRPVILNLPATVELATPNVYADQVEWMHRSLARRDGVILSVHPHNDRGTAVAAAELALMAGAQRVEGCLFGNGERTGNVDLVTLALNLYTQGVEPGLDFSDINAVAKVVQECTQLPIHPRHPYVGDLVFTAFSGSHQDAIKKGLAVQPSKDAWQVPYLPVDPKDLGRTYDSLIRVNSQSGKGGIAYLLETHYGITLPRKLQIEFSAVVQALADAVGTELTAEQLWSLFEKEYLREDGWALRYLHHALHDDALGQRVELSALLGGVPEHFEGRGNGPLAAAVHALCEDFNILSFQEYSREEGSGSQAVAFVEMAAPGVPGSTFGVGMDANIVTASLRAIFSAINRLHRKHPELLQLG